MSKKEDKIKDLEKKIKALQDEVDALKNEPFTFSKVKIGDKFTYKGLEFTKLTETLSIIDTYNDNYSDCQWDNVNNDYDSSLIRYYINNRYLDLMGIDRADLDKIYKDDLVTLISREEYEEHRDNIEIWDRWWATRSTSSYIAYSFCNINSNGYIYYNNVYETFGVRACFNFKPDTIVS